MATLLKGEIMVDEKEKPDVKMTYEQNVAKEENEDLEVIIPGRMNRAKYLYLMLIIGLVGGVLIETWIYFSPDTYLAPVFLVEIATLFPVVKRLHDIDRSGAWWWAMFVPGFNIFLALMLLFVKGTVGVNQFGNNPLQKRVYNKSEQCQN